MKYSPTYWYCIRNLLTRAFGLLIPVTTEANAESNWQFIASSMCLESFCPALPPTSRTSLTVVLSPPTSSGWSCKLFRWQNQGLMTLRGDHIPLLFWYFHLLCLTIPGPLFLSLNRFPNKLWLHKFQKAGKQVIFTVKKCFWKIKKKKKTLFQISVRFLN